MFKAWFLAVSLLISLVAGCTWIEHVKDSISSPEDAAWLKGAPDWVAKGCRSHPKGKTWFACAVGMNQNNGNMNTARTKAVANGVDQLARMVFDQLHPMARSPKMKQKLSKGGVKISKEIYATPMAGATTVDSWISRRGNRFRAFSLNAIDAEGLRKTVALIDQEEQARVEKRRNGRARVLSAFTGEELVISRENESAKPEPKAEPKPEPKAEPKPEPKAEPKPKPEAPTAEAPSDKDQQDVGEDAP